MGGGGKSPLSIASEDVEMMSWIHRSICQLISFAAWLVVSYAHKLVSEERESQRKDREGLRDIPTVFHEVPGVFPLLKVNQLGSKKLGMRLGETCLWLCSNMGKDCPPTISGHF